MTNKLATKSLLPIAICSVIILFFYSLWAIQPVIFDDWLLIKPHEYFRVPCLPKTAQEIRYCFDGRFILLSNAFSLFKPWILFTACFVTILSWRLLSFEKLWIKTILVVVLGLGFPFLAHISTWNLAASEYTLSAFWVILWYVIYRKVSERSLSPINLALLFVMSFIAATWYELWIAVFGGAVVFLASMTVYQFSKKTAETSRNLTIFLIVALGYLLVVAFYLYPGFDRVIEKRWNYEAGYVQSLFNSSYLMEAAYRSIRDILYLFKNFIPIFCLVLFLKLNKTFRSTLEKDFYLFIAGLIGAFLFIVLLTYCKAPFHYRTKLLVVYLMTICAIAIPQQTIHRIFKFLSDKQRDMLRIVLCVIVVGWMGYNAYFTYVHTNVDVMGWMKFRHMVASRDRKALDRFCCRTFSAPELKGKARRDHEWGAQDNQFRFYDGPSDFYNVKNVILAYWGEL